MKPKSNVMRRLALSATLLVPLCAATNARASDITFAVIGPQEYNLPVNFAQPFNAFVQYGEYNNQSKAWNGAGQVVRNNGGNLYEGLSKYVRFFTLDGVPNVGFAYEVIVPEVRIELPGNGIGGIGDPLTGPAIWFKPTPQSTLGFQSFLQIPIGASDVSNHYWANYSSIFFDHQWTHVSVTGNLGAVFRSVQNVAGSPNIDEGTSGHFNLRVGWKTGTMFEPFLGFDWQATSASHYSQTGFTAAPASHEAALGAGVMANFNASTSLTLRYSHDILGMNTVVTNAAYLKFAYVW